MTMTKARRVYFLGAGFLFGGLMQIPLLISVAAVWVLAVQVPLSVVGLAMMIVAHRRLSQERSKP